MATRRIISWVFDKHGHPRSPWQFRYEVLREDVADIQFRRYVGHVHTHVTISCVVDGERKELKAHVRELRIFEDGQLVYLMPLLESDFYEPGFKMLMLWIPNEGDCGIL